MTDVNSYADYPATARQRSEWFHYSKHRKRPNFAAVVETANVDQDAVRATFEILVKRHEGLRTTFINIDGLVKQRVHQEINYDIDSVDISAVNNQKEVLQEMYDQFNNTEFKLENAPLFKVVLVRLDAVNYVLGFTIDHIVSDMHSIVILKEEFSFIYQCIIKNRPIELGSIDFQMKDYALWEEKYYHSDSGRKNLAYWLHKFSKRQKVFKSESVLEKGSVTKQGRLHHFFISNRKLSDIEQISSNKSTFLMAVLLLWLSVLLKNKVIIISLPLSTRERRELEGVVGYMISDIFLSIEVDLSITFDAFLESVWVNYAEALSHRHYSHRDIDIDIYPYCAAKCSNTTEIRNNFDYKKDYNNSLDAPPPYYPIDCTVSSYANGWAVTFNYNKFLFRDKTDQHFDSYMDFLNMVVNYPKEKIGRLATLFTRHQ